MTRELAGRQNGLAIRALRIKSKLSTAELAEMVGLHEQALRNIENGSKPAGDMTVEALAQALGVPTGAITRDGREVPAPEPAGRVA